MNLVFAKSGLFVRKSQKGFTLLELLVVITLLAVLSVGALVAYEGIGEGAQATAASNNIAGADRAIRTYKAVELAYPNQWDSLATAAGARPAFMADSTAAAFGVMTAPAAGAFRTKFDKALEDAGIEELQARLVIPATVGVEPNLQHNEGSLGANALTDVIEDDVDNFATFSILPTFGTVACQVNGAAPAIFTKLNGTAFAVADGQVQNKINDKLEADQCNLVVALGFGHDAAHSTAGSKVAISTAPTYVSKTINPANNYARYVALFHMGADTGTVVAGVLNTTKDNNITTEELFNKATLLAVVDTEGNVIDEQIAAQDANQ